MQNIPKNVNGKKMNAECWQVKEQELGQRMTDHQVLNGKRNFSSIVSFCLMLEVLLQYLQLCCPLKYPEAVFLEIGEKDESIHSKFIQDLHVRSQTIVDSVTDTKERSNRKEDEHPERDHKKNAGNSLFKQPKRFSD